MPLMARITAFARSPQGQRLIAEAQRRARDPRTQQQVRAAAQRILASRRRPR